MPRHHSRIKKLAREKAAAEQSPYKLARRALLAEVPAGGAVAPVPDRLAAALRARPVIGVVSSARGSGVSVLAANLALALAGAGRRVLVLDTERAELSPWRYDAEVLDARSGGRITVARVSFDPFLPADPLWDEVARAGWSDDDPRWDLPVPERALDPDAVLHLVGDDGRPGEFAPGLVEAQDVVVIDASRVGGNHAGDLLVDYVGARVAPLQLRVEQLAAEEDWDELDEQDGLEPRLGEPFPASEVVDAVLRSRFTAPPAHLPGTGLAVVAPSARDGFRLDPGFPAEFARLMAQRGVPVLCPWIPRLERAEQQTRSALAAPGDPAAALYARLAGLLYTAAAERPAAS